MSRGGNGGGGPEETYCHSKNVVTYNNSFWDGVISDTDASLDDPLDADFFITTKEPVNPSTQVPKLEINSML